MAYTWDDLDYVLCDELAKMDDPGAFLTLGEKSDPPSRYVQAIRLEEPFLRLECVGDTSFSAEEHYLYPMTPEQVDALRSAGWETPPPGVFPNFRRRLPDHEVKTAARLLLEALGLLGLGPDTDPGWDFRTGQTDGIPG